VTQLDLSTESAVESGAAWQAVLEEIRAIVNEIGPKTVAAELDLSPSHLNHCLNERERNNLPAKAVPYFVRRAKTDRLAELLVGVRGLDVVPKKIMTPEEELARFKAALSEELGPGARKAVLDRVYGEKAGRR
jgi:hypothetical protein